MKPNIILTGFMGTGKSSVGRIVAEQLGFRFVDTDDEIERHEGSTVAEIFSKKGEPYFRELERDLCSSLVNVQEQVIATGGGMPVSQENRKLLNEAGVVFRLKCPPEEIVKRVSTDGSRPLIKNENPVDGISALLNVREPAYRSAPFQIDTGRTSPRESAEKILKVYANVHSARFVSVDIPGEAGYSIAMGPDLLQNLGLIAANRDFSERMAVVTDSNVAELYLDNVMNSLKQAGFNPFSCILPPGEAVKNLGEFARLHSLFAGAGLDRRGLVIALGGGVVGDLAGFAAAAYMRGVGLIQCPTTLLAMIDSSVGGKTGVDLPEGKNLVGAFKQPAAVLADTNVLKTLPQAEVRMGLAEFIKHAIIGDCRLFNMLEAHDDLGLPEPELVARSVRVKIFVVESDPLEQGRREVLNLGHTVGHAIEKVSDYSIGHGDAVGIGLVAASLISKKTALCSPDIPARIESVLNKARLPVRHAFDPDELVRVMALDKKSRGGILRFVLIKDIGSVQHGLEVDPGLVKEVLREMAR